MRIRSVHPNQATSPRRKASMATLFSLACMVCLATTAGAPLADDEQAFAVYKLSVPDYLQRHWIEDLDNDGLKDILVVHRKGLPPDELRWVSIFWQGTDGSFSTAADQSWELDTEAVILDIGDVVGDAKKEICYLTSKDVRYHTLEQDRYRVASDKLFDATGMAVYPSKSRVPLTNFVRDWNESGLDDVSVFTFDGLEIHSASEPGEYDSKQLVNIHLETGMGISYSSGRDEMTAGLRARYSFPDVTLID
ncbi:MAG: VCBS repeat-containing protein, partial [Hyphomicrobiaceae bacterium]|nr:VCBS repeat-containing protein [Hyphomicrobiaceae bacterium]